MKAPIPLLLAVLALRACGSPAAGTASHSRSTPASPAAKQPTPQSISPAPAATPGQAPAPPPSPLVIVRSLNGMVAAATTDGAFVWSFDPAHLGIANPTFVTN